jgi:hypothetical protein
MKFIELRQAANMITNGTVAQAFHKLLDALVKLGMDVYLDGLENGEAVMVDGRIQNVSDLKEGASEDKDEDLTDDQLELETLEGENDYVQQNLPEPDNSAGFSTDNAKNFVESVTNDTSKENIETITDDLCEKPMEGDVTDDTNKNVVTTVDDNGTTTAGTNYVLSSE